MSSQLEQWHFIKDGKIYLHEENDGYQFLKRGAEANDTFIMTVEEAKRRHVYGKLIKEYEKFKSNELE
tara:strand:- start:49 stop:252 length:204 start_codon:yes stop_codon:yes gene_type:complete